MSGAPKVLSVGVVDELGIASSSGLRTTWEQLGCEAPGNGRIYRTITGKQDQTFRRLDRATRALVLAAEACGISERLSTDERDETALVIETSYGCIEADLRYARLLKTGIVHAAIFPYTLPSTCLGDVTLRHGLRGPTLSLSIERDQAGEALREAQRILSSGAARFVVAGSTDVLGEVLPGATPALRAVVCILTASEPTDDGGVDWPAESTDPFGALASACR